MLIAILAFAIIFGGIAAVAALIAGWSFLAALAIYSGAGLLGVLVITLSIATASALRGGRADLVQRDALAGN